MKAMPFIMTFVAVAGIAFNLGSMSRDADLDRVRKQRDEAIALAQTSQEQIHVIEKQAEESNRNVDEMQALVRGSLATAKKAVAQRDKCEAGR